MTHHAGFALLAAVAVGMTLNEAMLLAFDQQPALPSVVASVAIALLMGLMAWGPV